MPPEREDRNEPIIARIALPVIIAVLIALIAGGTAPWWWDRVFPVDNPVVITSGEPSTSAQASASPEASALPPPSVSQTPQASEEPTFLAMLQGEWELETWQERPGAVTLCFRPLSGLLVFDAIGHASWVLEIDDCGPQPQFTPELRCLGIVDPQAHTLTRFTGGALNVDGEQLIGEERDWTSNLNSLRNDTLVAFCGSALAGSELFVYETTQADFSITIAEAGDPSGTRLLTLRNAAGSFTWRKLGP